MAAAESSHGLVPVRLMATHELVLDQIQTAINLGRFRPGDRLPPERDLADMLRVSRTTVREAVAVLESQGVIEVRRGRNGGLIVRELSPTRADIRKRLRAHRDQLQDIFDYRVAVESAAAALAAERRTAVDVTTLRRLVDSLAVIVDDAVDHPDSGAFPHFQDIDSQLHLAIAKAGRSPRLAAGILEARSAMFLPVGAVFARIEPSANLLHQQVVDAIDAGDADAASNLMAQHINGTRATVEAWL